jgi:hypothetical protein
MNEDTKKEAPEPEKKNSVLIGEVFTTSGPRKNHDEDNNRQNVELGEDSGGVVLLGGEHAFVWVADGTSQTSKRGAYSSRVLALDLGLALASKVTAWWLGRGKEISPPADQLTAQAIEEVFNQWQESLKPSSPLYEMLTGELRSTSAFHEFSTTFAAGSLSRRGYFNLASIGDSYLILNDTAKSNFFALEKGQITFHLKWQDDRLVFEKYVPPLQYISAKDINLVVLSTDGTKDTIKYLYETTASGVKFDLGYYHQLKKSIAQVRPRVQDDKTLAILGRFDED